MNIKDLQNRIINLEDFLQQVSKELVEKTKFARVIFYICNNKNKLPSGYNPHKRNIFLTSSDLNIIKAMPINNSYWCVTDLQYKFYPQKIKMFKIRWKLWLRGISIIMPIYYDNEIFCLFLFKNRFNNNQHYYLKNVSQELTNCLISIMLYNQTLQGIIKNHIAQIN